ncbi:MazG nucleotide pyrophosphohydrolase domain protein [compost metagenome]
MLTEEVGELAKAVRKNLNYTIDRNKIDNYYAIEEEIADVFIVLTSICNNLNLNLSECILLKEKENINRVWN